MNIPGIPENLTVLSNEKAWQEWHAKALAGEKDLASDVVIRKPYLAEIKQEGKEEDRKLRFVITTPSVDRDRDTIAVDGWEFDSFEKNPVVLWVHDHWSPPIGRAPGLVVQKSKVIGIPEFPKREICPLADTIYQLAKNKFINMASVGFDPKEWVINEERHGIDFKKQDRGRFIREVAGHRN
jgi:hypothetical protein